MYDLDSNPSPITITVKFFLLTRVFKFKTVLDFFLKVLDTDREKGMKPESIQCMTSKYWIRA